MNVLGALKALFRKRPRVENQDSNEPAGAAADCVEHRPQPITDAARTIEGAIDRAVSKYGHYEKQRSRESKRNFVLTAMATTVGIFVFVATAYQACVTRMALDFAKSQERAWATANIRGEYVFQPGKEAQVVMLIHNFGKSPAINAEIVYDVRIQTPEKIPEDLFIRYPPEKRSIRGLIVPNGVMHVITKFTLEPMDFKAMTSWHSTVVIYGLIAYTDQGGTKGEGGFCRAYNLETKTFAYCQNVVDWAK